MSQQGATFGRRKPQFLEYINYGKNLLTDTLSDNPQSLNDKLADNRMMTSKTEILLLSSGIANDLVFLYF